MCVGYRIPHFIRLFFYYTYKLRGHHYDQILCFSFLLLRFSKLIAPIKTINKHTPWSLRNRASIRSRDPLCSLCSLCSLASCNLGSAALCSLPALPRPAENSFLIVKNKWQWFILRNLFRIISNHFESPRIISNDCKSGKVNGTEKLSLSFGEKSSFFLFHCSER